MPLLMSGAVNSIAELGTADRSTNIEVVTSVRSGFGGGSLVAGLLAGDVQETVIATMHAAAVTVSRLTWVAPIATVSPPALVQYRAHRAVNWTYLTDNAWVGDGRVRNSTNEVNRPCDWGFHTCR
jgi:hypothetical protein